MDKKPDSLGKIVIQSFEYITSGIKTIFGLYVEAVLRLIRAMKRRPVLAVFMIFSYIFILSWPLLLRSNKINYWDRITGREELELRILDLQTELDKRDEIIDALTNRKGAYSLYKDLTFEESWETEENRVTIQRLLEYADFAIEKEDYPYAEQVYQEALQIQETLSVHYNLGRLYYLQGNLTEAESEWKSVLELDSRGQYPEVRFYLGVLQHEKGSEDESNNNLSEYLYLINKFYFNE